MLLKKRFIWFPSDYLYDSGMYATGSSREFCTGVRANDQPGPSILGGQFMRHYDVYFNRDQNRISFIRSNCDEIKKIPGIKKLLANMRRLVMSVYQAGINFHFSLGLFVFAGLFGFFVWKQFVKEKL